MQYRSKSRKLKFSIPQFGLEIPEGKTFVGIHVVIEDFYLATDPLIVEDKIYPVSELKIEDDTYVIVTDILLNLDTALAMKYRFAFNDQDSMNSKTMLYSEFSIPTSFYGDQEGVKLDGLTVLTPVLAIEEKLNMVNGDILRVVGSKFTMPIGETRHKFTNWKIYNADNTDDVIFQRRMDKSNLTEIELDLNLFKPTKLYVIECSYVSEDNVESLTGRYYYNRVVEVIDAVEVKPILPFYIDYDWYFKVNIQTPGIEKIGLNIYYVDENEKLHPYVKVKEHDIRSSIKVPSGIGIDFSLDDKDKYEWSSEEELKKNNFDKYGTYRAFFYLVKDDGSKTKEVLINEFKGQYEGRCVYPQVKLNYPGKYTAMWPIETGDFVCSSQELMGGVFLLGNYTENTLSFFKRDGQVLRDLGFKLELPKVTTDESGFPIFTVVEGNDGFIYINYPAYEDPEKKEEAKRSVWLVGKLNPITYEFKTLAYDMYPDEILIKSAGKAVSGVEGVYYIPSGTLKDDGDAKTASDMNTAPLLESGLYHIRPILSEGKIYLSRTKVIDKLVKHHFTGFVIASDDVAKSGEEEKKPDYRNYFILAGKNDSTDKLSDIIYTVSEERLKPVWKENKVLEFPEKETIEIDDPDDPNMKLRNGICYSKALKYYNHIPSTFSIAELEAVSLYSRGDGKHVLFNDSLKGKNAKSAHTRVLTLNSFTASVVTMEPNDSRIDLPFTNTVQLRDGGFIRLTSNVEGLQRALYYVPVPLEAYHDYEAKANELLIVRRNQVVKVHDLTRYSKVVIEGDDMNNTGKLVLIDNGKYKNFDFRDLIITRDTVVTETENALHKKYRLYLLPGVKYEIAK